MNYLRILGAAAVALCAFLLGWGHTKSQKKTAALLSDLSSAMCSMADEISALQTPLPHIIARLAQNRMAEPFFSMCNANHASMPLGEAWQKACVALGLSDDELGALGALAPQLGRLDSEAQSAQLRLAATRLNAYAQERAEKLRRDGKSPAVMGACLGIMCAIALF